MKAWFNTALNVMVAYQSDIPNGYPGLDLRDLPDAPGSAPAPEAVAPEVKDEEEIDAAPEDEKDALTAKYVEKYGRKPHPKMALDNLINAVNGN